MLHDINFGYFITLVLYSISLIGRVIYLDCMKYHYITIGGGSAKYHSVSQGGEGVLKGSILNHEINEQPLIVCPNFQLIKKIVYFQFYLFPYLQSIFY